MDKNEILTVVGILAIIGIVLISGCVERSQILNLTASSDVIKQDGVLLSPDEKKISDTFYEHSPIYICGKINAWTGGSSVDVEIYKIYQDEIIPLNISVRTEPYGNIEGRDIWVCVNLSNLLDSGKYKAKFLLDEKTRWISFNVKGGVSPPSFPNPNLEKMTISKPSLIGSIEEVQEFLKIYPKRKFSPSDIGSGNYVLKIYSDEGCINYTLWVYVNKINMSVYNIVLESVGGFCSPTASAPAMRSLESDISRFLKNEKLCDYDTDCFVFEDSCYNFLHIEKYRATDMCDRSAGCRCINDTCTVITKWENEK